MTKALLRSQVPNLCLIMRYAYSTAIHRGGGKYQPLSPTLSEVNECFSICHTSLKQKERVTLFVYLIIRFQIQFGIKDVLAKFF